MLAPAQNLLVERRPLAALDDIVDPWRRLAERAAEPNVFYTPDFALAAAPATLAAAKQHAAPRDILIAPS